MHRGWYPLVDNQAFRRGGPPPRDPSPDGRPPDTRHPVEKAIEHLSKTFPLKTPEWAAWSATMRPARLEGTWALRATEAGKGDAYGRMVLTPVAGAADEFTTEITYIYARTGERVTRTGRATIYTGFQWRGRSSAAGTPDTALREVMFVDRDWRTIEGRWFTGGYDEIGLDVRLERSGETRVLGTDRTALRVGATAQELKIYGANLPAGLAGGAGRSRPRHHGHARGVSHTGAGHRDASMWRPTRPSARAICSWPAPRAPKALAVYDSVDAIKVTPAWAMARVGGVTFPKALAQFEARAFDNGADNKPDTPDDIDLGLVDATWSLEEFAATYDDDDIKFVGEIDKSTGRFTPNIEGPNTARKGSRNNIGDVYVVAMLHAGGGRWQAGEAAARAGASARDRAALHALGSAGWHAVGTTT